MKLIVGLGNPGKEYENTRHNIGFIFLDNFANKLNVEISKNKFNGLYVKTKYMGQDVILLKPLSYMNLSGEVVRKFVDYFNIDVNDILIINDDLDLFLGNFKLKSNGSSGGHNGLKNIEQHLNTSKYKRLKIGISNNKNIDTKDYVLGHFSKQELTILEKLKDVINNVLEDFFKNDFDCLMSKYNSKNGKE